jgi:hypothetical protein
MAATAPSRLYPDSVMSPALLQPPGMDTAPQTPAPRRGATTPPSPVLDLRLPRTRNDCAQVFAAVEQAAGLEALNQVQGGQGQATASQAGQNVWTLVGQAFGALNVQSEMWAAHNHVMATQVEAHHASFHKAKKAIADLHGIEHNMEVSAAQKFASLDQEVDVLRQALQQHDAGNRAVVDQLAADIRTKVADIEASFAQGRWVDLIGKEVEKHAGAFTLLAGQATIVDRHVEGQGWVIKELKDEMKEVKDVLTKAVGHIVELETVEQSRVLSRMTQPLSPDRLVRNGVPQQDPLQSRILFGMAQPMSSDWQVGSTEPPFSRAGTARVAE